MKAIRIGKGVLLTLTLGIGALAAPGFATPPPDPYPPGLAVEPERLHLPAALAPRLEAAGAPTVAEDLVMRVNQERWTHGQLPPLKLNPLLAAAAAGHSANMGERDFFAHCDLDTRTRPADRVLAAGYAYHGVGENIAAGYSNAAAVMVGWMNSPGHRANILATDYREIGVGYYFDAGDTGNVRQDDGTCNAQAQRYGPYYRYWTQKFGFIHNVYPVVIDREAVATATREVALYVYGASWATELRLRNDLQSWTPWRLFATDVAWVLSPGDGLKTVSVEIRDAGGTVRAASDTIWLTVADDPDSVLWRDDFESP